MHWYWEDKEVTEDEKQRWSLSAYKRTLTILCWSIITFWNFCLKQIQRNENARTILMSHNWLWYIVISNISLCLYAEFSHLAEPESSAQRWSSGFIRESSRLWISWTGRKMQCQLNIHQGLTIKSASTSRKANQEAYPKWCLDSFVLHTFSQPWIMHDYM